MSRRRLSSPVVLSLAVHAAALGGLAVYTTRAARPARPATLHWIDIETPAPRATDDKPPRPPRAAAPAALPARAAAPSPRRDRPPAPRGAPTPRAPADAPESAPATAPGTEDTGGLLSMRATEPARHAREPDPGPVRVPGPGALAQQIEADPGPAVRSPLALPARPPAGERSELVPDGDGTYRKDDLTFTAKIDRDGRVHIRDKPNVQAHPDQASVSFDTTDALMRAAGMDPYYHRKALFLERTRAERAAMSADERRARLRDSLAQLSGRLAEIWAHRAWSAETRRRMLFELWDDCAETGPEPLVRAARQARATIVAFIRRHLPAGSPDAYAPSELARLNQTRTSRAVFAPYP